MTVPRAQAALLPGLGSVVTGDAGMGLVQMIASLSPDEGGLGCVFRPLQNADVGVDGHLEIRNLLDGRATGRFVGVQVKSGRSYFARPSVDGWTIRVRLATVDYWRNYAVPVVLVIVDTAARTAYWAPVSSSDFPLSGRYYRILVPSVNRFEASSADAIRAIATQAPPSLASRINLPSDLAAEEALIRGALRTSSTPAELLSVAQRAYQLALRLRSARRPYDASFMWREAVSAYIRAGDSEAAFRSLATLMTWLVRDLREADFALTVYRDALASGSPSPTVVPMRTDDSGRKAQLIKAYGEATCGVPALAEQASQRLRSMASDAELNEEARQAAQADLLVADAIARGDHRAASEAYAKLAEALPTQVRSGALLRRLLHAGLAGQAEEQLQAIVALPAEQLSEVDRSLCLGWLRASTQDFVGARSDFLAAGEAARAADRPYVAMRAFRNAELCERRARIWPANIDSPGDRAYRMENLATQRSGDRVSHARFMDRIDNRLARGELRQAFLAAREAAFYSWQDIDLAAFEDVQVRYAAVMRAAAIDTPSPDIILEAITATAVAQGALDKKESETNLEQFLRLLDDRLVPAFAERVWQSLEASAIDLGQISGVLYFAEKFASDWAIENRDSRMATLIGPCLQLGFGADRNGPAAKAIALVLALTPPLEGNQAAEVRDALARNLDRAPWNHVVSLLNAMAVTIAAAPMPADGGDQLAQQLLGYEARAAQIDATPHWFGTLAMLRRRAAPDVSERLSTVLMSRALAASGGSALEWYAAERAIAGGLDLPDAVAGVYLTGMSDLLDELRRQTRSTGLGGGASDVGPLTWWAAQRATESIRERAVRSGIAFLLYPEHLLHERSTWIPFIARIARYTRRLVPEAADALIQAASGQLTPSGDYDSFTNPFAFFRITGHTSQALRARSLRWLATLLPAADEQTTGRIVQVLSEAAADPDPEIRLAAVLGGEWVIEDASTSAIAAVVTEQILLPLTGDRVSRIAIAAYKGIRPRGPAAT